MRVSTLGVNFYIGSSIPVMVREGMHCENNIDDRFRLIFLLNGSGIIELGARFSPFIAPTVCCINETETIKIQSSTRKNNKTKHTR